MLTSISFHQLFEGKPTLKHLSLWNPDATFIDPLTTAQGYNRYAAQWYALAQLFSPVEIQSHEVVSSGNPIEVKLHNKYTLPSINKQQDIHSLVKIWVDSNGKIDRVEDRWDGQLPEGALSEVCLRVSGKDNLGKPLWLIFKCLR